MTTIAILLLTPVLSLSFAASAFGAAAVPDLLKAKTAAESRGYILETSRDHIVAKARKEGQLGVLSSLESLKEMKAAFTRKYPFINVRVEEITGTDAHQRFARELNAGMVKEWDVINASSDFYSQYTPFLKRFDLLGMASNGVVAIPTGMIDRNNRNVVAVTSQFAVVAYNKTLISQERIPQKWEAFLKPELIHRVAKRMVVVQG